MDAYDPGNPPLNLDFKRRNRCFGRRNRKGIKGPRNPMVVGLAMALGLLLRGPERVGKGRYEKRKVFLGNYGSHTKSWMLLYGGQASPTPPLPANQNTNSEASPTPPVDRNERYSQDELISMYTRVRQAQERNDPNYEKLYDRYLDMENANKPWKGQKDGKKPRKMSKEDIREWEKHLPKDDVYARLFKRHPNEPQDGDPETDAATDIEGDFAIKREWGYSNKPLPPPEEPPPMDGPSSLERYAVQVQDEEEKRIHESEWVGSLETMPINDNHSHTEDDIDYAAIFSAPDYRGKRQRGGKSVRQREATRWKKEKNRHRNKDRSDYTKIARIIGLGGEGVGEKRSYGGRQSKPEMDSDEWKV